MALTAKERKQKQLEREHEQLRKLPDSTYEFLDTPFYPFTEESPNWSNIDLLFDLMGLEPPMFEDDRGPEAFASDVCFSTDEDREDTFRGVRRQGFWNQWRPKLRESLAHLVGLIMRRAGGDASVALRVSFV